MKKIIFTTILVASFGASTAHANEVFQDNPVTTGLSGVSAEAAENLRECLKSNTETAPGKAIRACSKAYKASIPNHDIRSDILTRRGWLRLSSGKLDRASRDFKSAASLNNENELAYLGEGFAAMLDKDYQAAVNYFNDCRTHNEVAPLAMYGLAMTKELSGDIDGAIKSYEKAADMRPDWQAPRAELARVKSMT